MNPFTIFLTEVALLGVVAACGIDVVEVLIIQLGRHIKKKYRHKKRARMQPPEKPQRVRIYPDGHWEAF